MESEDDTIVHISEEILEADYGKAPLTEMSIHFLK